MVMVIGIYRCCVWGSQGCGRGRAPRQTVYDLWSAAVRNAIYFISLLNYLNHHQQSEPHQSSDIIRIPKNAWHSFILNDMLHFYQLWGLPNRSDYSWNAIEMKCDVSTLRSIKKSEGVKFGCKRAIFFSKFHKFLNTHRISFINVLPNDFKPISMRNNI